MRIQIIDHYAEDSRPRELLELIHHVVETTEDFVKVGGKDCAVFRTGVQLEELEGFVFVVLSDVELSDDEAAEAVRARVREHEIEL